MPPHRYSARMKTFPIAIFLLIGLLLIASLGGCSREVTDQTVTRVSPSDVASRLDRVGKGVELLDARDLAAYNRSHIPGARHVTLPEIDPGEPTKAFAGKGTLIVYGENPNPGPALAIAKRLFRTMNMQQIEYMEAGFSAWVEAGLPTTGQ